MSRRIAVILMLAVLPSALMNGYVLARPTVLDDSSPPGEKVADDDKQAPAGDPSPEKPSDQDTPVTGTPVVGLPALSAGLADYSAPVSRTFDPVRSRTLPVGLWRGQTLSVPRPFSRLDRVVALSCCDATALLRIARNVRSNSPPPRH